MSKFEHTPQMIIQDVTFDTEIRSVASELVLSALNPTLSGRGLDTFTGSGCHRVLAGLQESLVIGAVGCSVSSDKSGILFVERLAVHPEYRQRGVAQELLAATEVLAREAGATALRLCATRNSLQYYHNRGFMCPDPARRFELERAVEAR